MKKIILLILLLLFTSIVVHANEFRDNLVILDNGFKTVDDIGDYIVSLIKKKNPELLRKKLKLKKSVFLIKGLKWAIQKREFKNIKSWTTEFEPITHNGKTYFAVSIIGHYTKTLKFNAFLYIGFKDQNKTKQVLENTHKRYLEILTNSFNQTITPKEALSDLDYLKEQLEDIHPNLYYLMDRNEFAVELSKIKKKCSNKISIKEFSKEINRLIAKIKDGHTGVSYHGAFFKYATFKGYFPLKLKMKKGQVITEEDYTKQIKPGSQLLKINGIEIKTIIKKLEKYNNFTRNEMFNDLVLRYLGYYLWYEFDIVSPFTIEVDSRNFILNGCNKSEFQEKIKGSESSEDYEFKHRKNVGVLSFYSCNDITSFEELMQKSLKTMKNKRIKNFIIDIRNNSGGNSGLCDYLFECISNKPYRTYSKVEIKISNLIKKEWGYKEKKGSLQTLNCKLIKPKRMENRFTGNVYVLTGPFTFSTATDFAAMVKDFGVGKIIGEETGGLATSYGDSLHFSLPNSNIPINESYKRFVRPNGLDTGKGVIPDIQTKNALEKTLKIIEDKK